MCMCMSMYNVYVHGPADTQARVKICWYPKFCNITNCGKISRQMLANLHWVEQLLLKPCETQTKAPSLTYLVPASSESLFSRFPFPAKKNSFSSLESSTLLVSVSQLSQGNSPSKTVSWGTIIIRLFHYVSSLLSFLLLCSRSEHFRPLVRHLSRFHLRRCLLVFKARCGSITDSLPIIYHCTTSHKHLQSQIIKRTVSVAGKQFWKLPVQPSLSYSG